MQIDQFYQQFDLQRTALTHDIHIHDDYADPEPPWYVKLLIGLGGWLLGLSVFMLATAIVALLFGENVNAFWQRNIGIGAALMMFGWSMRYLSIPDSIVDGFVLGGLMFAANQLFNGFPGGKVWPLLPLYGLALAISISLRGTLMLQGTIAAILAGLIAAAALQSLAIDRDFNAIGWIFALQSLLGIVLFMAPARTNLRPLAAVALISAVLSPIVLSYFVAWPEPFNSMQISRLIAVSTLIVLFMMAWVGAEGTNRRLDVMVFSVLCLPAVILLPPAGSSALIVLVLAWCRGSSALALLGAALQLAFVVHYFRDPTASLITWPPGLMEKSLIMAGFGLAIIAVWAILALRETGPQTGGQTGGSS